MTCGTIHFVFLQDVQPHVDIKIERLPSLGLSLVFGRTWFFLTTLVVIITSVMTITITRDLLIHVVPNAIERVKSFTTLFDKRVRVLVTAGDMTNI